MAEYWYTNSIRFAPADDVVGHIKGINLDLLDIFDIQMLLLLELQGSLDGGLGVDLGVVALDDGLGNLFEVLFMPIQLEMTRNGIHETLVALEDFRGPGNAAHGKESRVRTAKSRIGIGQPFPVG